ncbi:MAG: alanine racemase [Ardenticatenaceae bacterium]|nr:alanine racemase [Ardenticatenaceae bacterium]
MAFNEATISNNGIVRPTHIEVNLTRLTENYRAIERAVTPATVMPILKANAYGHGLVEVARHVVSLGHRTWASPLEEGICCAKRASLRRFWCWAASSATRCRSFAARPHLTASIEKLTQLTKPPPKWACRPKST